MVTSLYLIIESKYLVILLDETVLKCIREWIEKSYVVWWKRIIIMEE